MSEENNHETNSSDNRRVEMRMPDGPGEPQPSHVGPILGVLIVVLVLILAGLYLWGATLSEKQEQTVPRQIENNEPETVRAEADAQILDTVSTSDELGSIEADLESTSIDGLDAELDEIDRELDSALGN